MSKKEEKQPVIWISISGSTPRNSLQGFETLVRVRDERQNRIGRRLS